MEAFLIESKDQNNQDKQFNFLRQPVALSGEIVPLK